MTLPERLLIYGLSALAGASLTPAGAKSQSAALDWNRIARVVVERIAPERGERVLLVGVPGSADELVISLRAAIKSAGATDLGFVAATEPATAHDLSKVDVGVMLPGAAPTHSIYSALQRAIATSTQSRVRTIHFHWAGAYSTAGALIDVTPERAALYQRALLQTDYVALAANQRAFDRAMRGNEVRVTTPAGTDLRFTIGDRPVTRQDGDASAARARQGRNLIDREIELPAGAIRVAPIEESVAGTIVFPPSVWGGERVEGLVLRFERGQVISIEARSGQAAVERELQSAGAAGRAFREFALGFNPLLAIPTSGEPWIPYYGYGAGVVRLSLGDNTELGGNVSGGYVRWNFFTDATVTVGREVWVRDGKLLKGQNTQP
jgi:leucyl aminopeptidase (aminopeptidase T)